MIRKSIWCLFAAVFIAAFLGSAASNLAFGTHFEYLPRAVPFGPVPESKQHCDTPYNLAEQALHLGYVMIGDRGDAVLMFHKRTGNYAVVQANADQSAVCITSIGNPELEGSTAPDIIQPEAGT